MPDLDNTGGIEMNRIRTIYIGAVALSAMLALPVVLAAQGADAAKSQSQVAVSSNAAVAVNDSLNLSSVNKIAEAGNVLFGRSEIVGFSRLTGNQETRATPREKGDDPGPLACIPEGRPCVFDHCCPGLFCQFHGNRGVGCYPPLHK
jgi:hypothetical protein